MAFDRIGFGMPIDSIPAIVDPAGLRASWGGVKSVFDLPVITRRGRFS